MRSHFRLRCSACICGELTSTPAVRVDHPNGIFCAVTNVTTKPIELSVDVVGSSGAVLSNDAGVTIAAGAVYTTGVAAVQIDGYVYCRANGYSNKKVHVTTCVLTETNWFMELVNAFRLPRTRKRRWFIPDAEREHLEPNELGDRGLAFSMVVPIRGARC